MARIAVNGRKLRELRLSKGLTAAELSKRAKISIRTLLEIEEGKRQANEETLFGLCKILGADAGTLMAEETVPPAAPEDDAPAAPKGKARAKK